MNNSSSDGAAAVILDVLPCDWMGSASQETVKHQPGDKALSCTGIDMEIVNMQAIIDLMNKDEADVNDVDITGGIYLPNMFV